MPHRGVFGRFALVHEREVERGHLQYARQDDESSSSPPGGEPTSDPASPSSTPPANPTTPPGSTPGTPPPNGSSTPPPNNPTTPPPRPPVTTPSVSIGSSTDANGAVHTFESTVYITRPDSSLPSPTDPPKVEDSEGLGKGTITGIAVAGSIALLAVIGFVVWKYMASRKRFSEFDADEIKWPELKEENHALPARPTGRHGAGLDGEDDVTDSAYSTVGPKGPYGAGHVHNDSASQLLPASTYATTYPPTQFSHSTYSDSVPYSDNPVPAGYADPYAVPPMAAGRQSPGPGVAYGGRAPSPGPGVAYGARSASPGPAMAYPGYDMAGRQSPGPNVAYGRQSPGPQVAYGGYDAGRRSPGPGQAYGGV